MFCFGSAPITERPVACRSSRSASGHAAGGIRSTASCVNVRMIFASRECCSPGITADRDRADPVADDAQEHDHAAVCGSKMLEGVDRDWPRYLASQRLWSTAHVLRISQPEASSATGPSRRVSGYAAQ